MAERSEAKNVKLRVKNTNLRYFDAKLRFAQLFFEQNFIRQIIGHFWTIFKPPKFYF